MAEGKIIDAAALELFKQMDEKYKRAQIRERETLAAYLNSRTEQTRELYAEALKHFFEVERERWALHEQYFVVTWEPDTEEVSPQIETGRGLTSKNIEGIRKARAAWKQAQDDVNKAIRGNAPKEELSAAFERLKDAAKNLREFQELTRGKSLTEPIDVSAGKLWIEEKVRALSAAVGGLSLEWGDHTGDKWEYTLRATSNTGRYDVIKFSLEQLSDAPFARETNDLEKQLLDFVNRFRS